MASSVKNNNTQKEQKKNQAMERAKQIENMMEENNTPEIIKWFYRKRKILITAIIIVFVIGIGFAVVFGIKDSNHKKLAEKYIQVYDVLKEYDEKSIAELEDSELGELKKVIKPVIEEGKSLLFKPYEYRLASYYMGIIEYSQEQANFIGAVEYFKEASKDKSYPFADYAYFNVGKSLEQAGFVYASDGNKEKAEETYRNAINHYLNFDKEFPDSFLKLRAKYQAGILYEEMNEYDKAKSIYEEIKKAPEFVLAEEDIANLPENNNEEVIKVSQNFVDKINNSLIRLSVISKMDNNNSSEENN